MKAYIFPGQGSQVVGMGKDLFESSSSARQWFQKADEILGFPISETLFSGTEEELKQTRITQPAIFIHSVIKAFEAKDFSPNLVAGHSLGEFSALVAAKALTFEEGLRLVFIRAMAMQKACEQNPSTMAAVLGLSDDIIVEVCEEIKEEIVVAANYNCPGQVVISGSFKGIEIASEKLKEKGAKRVLVLPVGGAFHSPLMTSAKKELAEAIQKAHFSTPFCPIYQNINAKPSTTIAEIKINLIEQLTGAVRWTQTIQNMVKDGANEFIECGPGKVLQGLVKKISPESETRSL